MELLLRGSHNFLFCFVIFAAHKRQGDCYVADGYRLYFLVVTATPLGMGFMHTICFAYINFGTEINQLNTCI